VKNLESISIIIPACNYEFGIAKTMAGYLSYLKRNFKEYELIVVCNNCSDNTYSRALTFALEHSNVSCLNFPFYIGKGGAVLEGFKQAKNELIGFVDQDNSVVPGQFGKLVKAIKGFHIAIASRNMPDSILLARQPLYRVALGKCFGFISEMLFCHGLSDVTCGAKLFRRKQLHKIMPLVKSKGFEFDTEMLWLAKRNGFMVTEVGIEWKDSGKTTLGLLEPIRMLAGILKLRLT